MFTCAPFSVVDQDYGLQVYPAYVYLGNTAVIRCLIPSFVKKYIKVTSWVASDGARITTDIHKGTTLVHKYVLFLILARFS